MKEGTAATPSRQRTTATKTSPNPPDNISRIDQVSDLRARSSSLPRAAASADKQTSAQSVAPGPAGEERIRQRAYEIYLECGCEDGHAEEHWLAAEREIREK